MRKYNRNKGERTITRSVRLPVPLDDRIGVLAQKGLITKSAWIVRTLERESKGKGIG